MNSGGDQSLSLGLRVQQVRKSAGLTQQQLCQKAKLAYSTLAKIERGAIASPSIFTIQSIAQSLNVSVDTLLGNEIVSPMQQKKISKSGVRFVYFDINGCLVRFYNRAFTQIAMESSVPADMVETVFWHYNDAVCSGKMSLDAFNTQMAQELGIENFNWQQYYFAAIEPITAMHEVVKWASQHYQVGLFSNIMPGFIAEMIKRKYLPDVEYAAIIDSSEVGCIKPEPEIFAVAQLKTGVSDQAVLLIDDSRTNIMAAERAGWRVIWFDDFRADESADRVKKALAF